MARKVPYSGGSTLQPVVNAAAENAEIYDSKAADSAGATMGRYPLAESVNGIDEQHRGALVCDYDPAAILDTVGEVAYYRSKILGGRDLGDETADVWLWIKCVDGGDPSPTTAQVDVSSVTAGDSISWVYSADLSTPTKVYLGTILVDDAGTYESFEVELISEGSSGLVAVQVLGVDIVYERKATAIPAGEYGNGQVSQDVDRYVGEAPLSVARERDLAGNLVAMYRERVGQVTSSAMPKGISGKVSTFSRGTVFGSTPPQDVTSMEFHVLSDVGDGAKTIILTGADSSLTLTPTAAGWYSGTIAVVAENPQRFELACPTLEVYSICSWWSDASNPGQS